LTSREREEIEAAVDAQFTEQKYPIFRKGSLKWVGLQRWSWYLNVFFSISVGDQASFAMSPIEHMRCWEEAPRLMTILSVVQGRVRSNMSKKIGSLKAKNDRKHLQDRS
jgi:hypothetical protein